MTEKKESVNDREKRIGVYINTLPMVRLSTTMDTLNVFDILHLHDYFWSDLVF